ncbi:ribosomal RNA processing protein 36 homolog [Sergentomyia squamirostris]
MSDSEASSSSAQSDANIEDDIDPEKKLIREELKDMPFEDLVKLKQKLGAKVYNATVLGIEHTSAKSNNKKIFKRENKNRPREMSFRKPVSTQQKKKNTNPARDPRFDEQCGDFDRQIFKKRYSFVEDLKAKEVKELRASLKKTDDPEEKAKIRHLIQRLENQLRESAKEKTSTAPQETDGEPSSVQFTNKKQQKLKKLVNQFEELKQAGKLKKHIEKRRKKNVSRDKKLMD